MFDTAYSVDTLLISIIVPAILGILVYIIRKSFDSWNEYRKHRSNIIRDKIDIYWQMHNYLKIHHDLHKRIEYLKKGKNYVSPSPDDENQFGITIMDNTISHVQPTSNYSKGFVHLTSNSPNGSGSVQPTGPITDNLDVKIHISPAMVDLVKDNKKVIPETSILRQDSVFSILNTHVNNSYSNMKYLILIKTFEQKQLSNLIKLKDLIHNNIFKLEPDEHFGELLSLFNRYVYLQECIHVHSYETLQSEQVNATEISLNEKPKVLDPSREFHDSSIKETNQLEEEKIALISNKLIFNQEFYAEFPNELVEYVHSTLKKFYLRKHNNKYICCNKRKKLKV